MNNNNYRVHGTFFCAGNFLQLRPIPIVVDLVLKYQNNYTYVLDKRSFQVNLQFTFKYKVQLLIISTWLLC